MIHTDSLIKSLIDLDKNLILIDLTQQNVSESVSLMHRVLITARPLAPALKAALPWTPPGAPFVSCRYCLKRQIGAVPMASASILAAAQTEVCMEAADIRVFRSTKSLSIMDHIVNYQLSIWPFPLLCKIHSKRALLGPLRQFAQTFF